MSATLSRLSRWPSTRLAAAVLGPMAVLLLTACGSVATVRRGQTVAVSVGEDRVAPQRIQAPRGLLTLEVHNNGRLSHDLTISRDGVTQAQTPPLAPGQGTVLQAVLAAGTYVIASSLDADQALGAYGTLQITR